jgi:hypothetical protein
MHACLIPSEPGPYTGPKCVVLSGLGGSGKTQAALEYTYEYGCAYDAMFWLRAESVMELNRSFDLIARKLKLPTHELLGPGTSRKWTDYDDSAQAVELAREWLEGTSNTSRLSRIDHIELTCV